MTDAITHACSQDENRPGIRPLCMRLAAPRIPMYRSTYVCTSTIAYVFADMHMFVNCYNYKSFNQAFVWVIVPIQYLVTPRTCKGLADHDLAVINVNVQHFEKRNDAQAETSGQVAYGQT